MAKMWSRRNGRPAGEARRATPFTRFRPRLVPLEDRTVPSSIGEIEPQNNSSQDPQRVDVPVLDIVTAPSDQWLTINADFTSGDSDWYGFRVDARAGVFFDIDSREVNLSTFFNSNLTVFRSDGFTLPEWTNDDGYDFEGFRQVLASAPQGAANADSSLYIDLPPGDYVVRVLSTDGSLGQYQLKMLQDRVFSPSAPALSNYTGTNNFLYLDVDGHTAAGDQWGTYDARPFNFDEDDLIFSPAERLAIKNIWAYVSSDYSSFNVTVTTVDPGQIFNQTTMRTVITSSSSLIIGLPPTVLGVAFLNSFVDPTLQNQDWAFAANFNDYSDGGVSGLIMAQPNEIGNTASHENGHTFNLEHYNSAAGTVPNATIDDNGIMATPDVGLNRERWTVGTAYDAANNLIPQDDMQQIGAILQFRADDHGNSRTVATTLSMSSLGASVAGNLEQVSDQDFLRFTPTTSGRHRISVEVDSYTTNIDIVLAVTDSNGVVLAGIDPQELLSGFVDLNLTAGQTYFLRVTSNGQPGATGVYIARVTAPGTTGGPGTPGGGGIAAPLIAAGADRGGTPQVNVYNLDGSQRFSFLAYEPGFRGGVRVATGDVDFDGVTDIITASGRGGGPHVKVFSGVNLRLMANFFAFEDTFDAGLYVGTGDVNNDGRADIIVGAGDFNPTVKVFSGLTGGELRSFTAYVGFDGGVTVAGGDVDGDGFDDIVTGPAGGGGPHVKVFSGATGAEIRSFFAYDGSQDGGVYVGAGDVTGDGRADIVTGLFRGSPLLNTFDGRTGGLINSFNAFDPGSTSPFLSLLGQAGLINVGYQSGLRVAVVKASDGRAFGILAAPGSGQQAEVRLFPTNPAVTPELDLLPFGNYFGGVYVG